MADLPLPTDLPMVLPTRQKIEAEGRSQRLRVTGKLKVALAMMVWDGEKRADAAEKAGLVDSSLRSALRKPHVLQHYHAELAALRTSLRARNVHRLDSVADGSKNDMARVAAIKTMEGIADTAEQQHKPGQHTTPGLVIVVLSGTAAPTLVGSPVIDAK